MVLRNGKTNGIRKPLSERSSCNFDTVGIVRLGVTGGKAVYSLQTSLLESVAITQLRWASPGKP
jgi:hypothetical protein